MVLNVLVAKLVLTLGAIYRVVGDQSPIAYIDNINTPLLIIHSDEDYRCALEQAEQMFAALRWRGKPVELIIFEGENHGLSRGGRPGNRIERQRRISRLVSKISRYVGGVTQYWFRTEGDE